MAHGPRTLFGRPAFPVLLAGLGAGLLGPPRLGIPARAGGAALWLYLLAAWAVLIALLAAAARSRTPEARTPPDPIHPREPA